MPNQRRSESKFKKISQYYISRKMVRSFSKDWQRAINSESVAGEYIPRERGQRERKAS